MFTDNCFGNARRLLTLAFAVLALAGQAMAKDVYTVGIVPQQSAAQLAENWGPLLAHLSAKTGATFRFATAPSIPEFEKRLDRGEYDFAYMNPYHFVVFHDNPGYLPLVRENKQIRGILVVKAGSPLKSVEEISGSTVFFPAPAAFAATILPQAELSRQGVRITPRYVSSHDSVYMGVAKGLAAVGGGIERTFGMIEPELRKELRILWKTRGYTPHAFAAHPSVPEPLRNSVRDAWLQLSDDPTGKALLDGVGFKKGVLAAKGSDWNDIRDLQLNQLDALK